MECTIETLVERPLLGVRGHVALREIGLRIGEWLPGLMRVAGPHACGPVLARWHAWDGEEGEMEVAVPVRAPVEGAGDVRASTLPAGRAVATMHLGPYDGLAQSWRALHAWLAEHGHEARAAPWEEYLDDCSETPAERLRTRLVVPIR
jgi:effector-binding domain-containing protein